MAQSFDLAGTFSTSDAGFYKNTPGISVASSWHFKKQFVFIELKTSKQGNNTFTEFAHNIFDQYVVKSVDGSFSTSSVNVGVAQKIVTSDCLEFSVGAESGLNYYKQDNDYIAIVIDETTNEIRYFNKGNEIEKRKNKFGFGAFIDLELKGIIFNNLSIFSRLNIYYSDYLDKPAMLDDDALKTSNINSLGYRIGLRYRIPSAKE